VKTPCSGTVIVSFVKRASLEGLDMNDGSGSAKSCLQVLHLEDDSLDAELIKGSLDRHGIACSITSIHTRDAFEAALQQGDIDLILSDSKLPGFDSLSAVDLAKERLPNVPFIFVSGTASPQIKADAFKRGATDFINKDDLPKLARVIFGIFFMGKPKSAQPKLPETGKPVLVHCAEFRCLGFLDQDGKWRDYTTSAELSGVIDWAET
jgi:CheY-like chemotaxis protein